MSLSFHLPGACQQIWTETIAAFSDPENCQFISFQGVQSLVFVTVAENDQKTVGSEGKEFH